jgi:succinyl-diaminopimelate desuccinylase
MPVFRWSLGIATPGTVIIAIDPVQLTADLVACPSITPARGRVFDVLEQALRSIGFAVHRFLAGEAPDGPVENLFATRGGGAPHFGFAGHLDVVPPGEGWAGDPFLPEIRGDLLVGRGVVDMKGGIAAFVAACANVPEHRGTLSLIITGDEEGPATHGTPALIEWMNANGHRPDMIVIGEPTSVRRLGDTVKIGRRGTVNMWITVPGVQGHVAYPHRTDNPVPKLARILAALDALRLDDGTDAFEPSNLEFTAVATLTSATNIVPGTATAQLNIRFNDLQRGEDLVALVRRTVKAIAPDAGVEARISGEAFLTRPGRSTGWSAMPFEKRRGSSLNCPRPVEPRMGASSSSSARWWISGCRTEPCTSWTKRRSWKTFARLPESTRASSGTRSAER